MPEPLRLLLVVGGKNLIINRFYKAGIASFRLGAALETDPPGSAARPNVVPRLPPQSAFA